MKHRAALVDFIPGRRRLWSITVVPLSFSAALAWLGLLFMFILINSFFVAAEYSLVRLRPSQVEDMVRRRVVGARTIQQLLSDMSRTVAGAQLGITISGLAVGGVGQEPIRQLLELAGLHLPATVNIAIAFLVLTICHVIIGEQLPKLLALRSPQTISLFLVVPFALFCRVMSPLLWLINGLTALILKLPGMPKPAKNGNNAPTPTELQIIIEESARAGELASGESNLLKRALELRGLTVFDIMVPQSLMDGLPEDMPLVDALEVISQTRHSRLPLFRNGRDAVVGILNTRELLDVLKRRLRAELRPTAKPSSAPPVKGNEPIGKLSAFIRKPFFVMEDTPAAELLEKLRSTKQQLAVVTNSGGKVVGLITQEDLLEQLVGEIHDEWDKPIEGVQKLADDHYSIDGEFTLFEFRKVFDARIISESDALTVEGVVTHALGRPAQVGDSVEISSFRFTVMTISAGGAISKLEVRPVPENSDDGAKDGLK